MGHHRRGRGRLRQQHEHRFHADRTERHVRRRQRDGHGQVHALDPPRTDRPVRHRVRVGADLDVALVGHAGKAGFVDQHAHLTVVRIHVVRRQPDRIVGDAVAVTIGLGHHVIADHPVPLADVQLMRPTAGRFVFVVGQTVPVEIRPPAVGDAGRMRQEVHQPDLIVRVVLEDPFAACRVGGGPVGRAAADVVDEERPVEQVVVVGVEPEVRPRVGVGFEQPRQHFVALFVVVRRPGERPSVVGVDQPHAEAIRLDDIIAVARRADVVADAWQQPARWVARHDVRIDRVVGRKVVAAGAQRPDAGQRFAVGRRRFAAAGVRHAGGGHQIALVRAIDELVGADDQPVVHPDRRDPRAVFDDFGQVTTVVNVDVGDVQHVAKDRLGLERLKIRLTATPKELSGDAAADARPAAVDAGQAPAGQSADVIADLGDAHRRPHPRRLHRRDDARAGPADDAHVDLDDFAGPVRRRQQVPQPLDRRRGRIIGGHRRRRDERGRTGPNQ